MSRASFILLVAIAVLFSIATSQEQQCGQNEEWTSCGSACQPSCGNPDPHQACTMQCVIGCRCKQGFLKKDGQCVSPQSC